MSFRIRNLNTWIILHKCKELGIDCELTVPEKEDFLTLKKGETKIIINRAISPYLKHIPGAITEDKITCNFLLLQAGFPVPNFIFSDSFNCKEKKFLEENKPIVVKPFDTNKGVGIYMDISNEEKLNLAIEQCKLMSSKVILQKQALGKDYRFLVINQSIEGVLWNELPYIIGNGQDSIIELIKKENIKRVSERIDVYGKQTEMLVEIPIEYVKNYLTKEGYSLTEILPENKKLYVTNCGNGWSGAISHDVTDKVHKSICDKILEVTNFLEIDVAGLDVRCIDIQKPVEEAGLSIIEVNTRPSLIDHEIPMTGSARPVTEKYLKYLFKM
ncbi:hypothetical protein [Riemerella columbina]|uniref:hypothetical protein n=1 Tax=Riemerella columbina TaxID=103810 RepID=UPI0003627C6D|nr:hypothetical protein [Riemerella columbina]